MGRRLPVVVELSAFSGFRFPPSVIMPAVRWYLRFGLSYVDVEELLAERGRVAKSFDPAAQLVEIRRSGSE